MTSCNIVLAPSWCPFTDLEYTSDVVIFADSSTTLQHVVNLESKLCTTYELRLCPDVCKQMWVSLRLPQIQKSEQAGGRFSSSNSSMSSVTLVKVFEVSSHRRIYAAGLVIRYSPYHDVYTGDLFSSVNSDGEARRKGCYLITRGPAYATVKLSTILMLCTGG
ncbi:hypothetical protein RB195_023451 [Necator americanus]|uniref:Uncharacterized protein n=1 Tax=Necator americanus TaxID=51031 RepID=A0ABR1ELQ0_NECAM